METALQYLYQDIETCNSYFNPPKAIRVTRDFYDYLAAIHKENLYLVKDQDNELSYIMGIRIIVDNTIDGYYEFEI